MDFLPLIIGIIVAIAVGASKNKKRPTTGAPTPHGENFPFPKEFAEMFGMEIPQQQSAEQTTAGVEEIDAQQEGVAMTVAQYKANSDLKEKKRVAITSDVPMEIERSGSEGRTGRTVDFDVRQAVIFSEILKPKFNDNF